jgi:hypothetical protein
LQSDSSETHNLVEEQPALFEQMKAQMGKRETSCQRSRNGADYTF